MATIPCLRGSAREHQMAALQRLPSGEFEAKVLQSDALPVTHLHLVEQELDTMWNFQTPFIADNQVLPQGNLITHLYIGIFWFILIKVELFEY